MIAVPSSRIIIRMPSWWSGNRFDKWWFANEAAILIAYPNWIASPTSRNGWKVTNGETDTIWVWDADTNAWVNSGVASSSWLVPTIASTHAALDALANLSQVVPWQTYSFTFRTKYLDPNDDSLFSWVPETLIATGLSPTQFEPIVSSVQFPNDIIAYDFTKMPLTLTATALLSYSWGSELFSSYNKMTSVTPMVWGFNIQLLYPLTPDSVVSYTVFRTTDSETWTFTDTVANYPSWTLVDNGWNSYYIDVSALGWSNPWGFTYTFGAGNFDFSLNVIQVIGETQGRITHRHDPIQNNKITVGNLFWNLVDTADLRASWLVRYNANPTANYPWLNPTYGSGSPVNLVNESTGLYGTITRTVVVNAGDKQVRPMFQNYSGIYQFNSEVWILTLNATFEDLCYGFDYRWIVESGFMHFVSPVFNVNVWPQSEIWWLFFGEINWMILDVQSEMWSDFHALSFENIYMKKSWMYSFVTNQVSLRNVEMIETYNIALVLLQSMNTYKCKGGNIQSMYLNCDNAEIFKLEFNLGVNVSASNFRFNATDSIKNNRFDFMEIVSTYGNVDLVGQLIDWNELTFYWPFANVELTNFAWNKWFWLILNVTGGGEFWLNILTGNSFIVSIDLTGIVYNCTFNEPTTSSVISWELYSVNIMKWFVLCNISWILENLIIFPNIQNKTITWTYSWTDFVGVSPNNTLWKSAYTNAWLLALTPVT